MRVAFLFDNDGVLIDSSELHWLSWCQLMKEMPEFKMNKEEFIRGFGKRNDLILQDVAPKSSNETRSIWADRKEELFRESAEEAIALLPGMENFLKQVLEAQIPRIIASSTPIANLQMFLRSTVLGKYFASFVSAEEVAHGKPFPDIFVEAAYRLGFEPQECVVFEDAPAGIQAGKDAGCFVVALETTHQKNELSGYDLIYSSADALNLQEILNAFTVWKKDA